MLEPRLADAAVAGREAHVALGGVHGGRQRLIQRLFGLGESQAVPGPRPGWLEPLHRPVRDVLYKSERSQVTYTWPHPAPHRARSTNTAIVYIDRTICERDRD